MPLAPRYRPTGADRMFRRNLAACGLGGLVAPFIGIKLIDLLLFLTAAVLSRTLLTEVKKTRERHRLDEVSAVVLQQALRDVEAAHRNSSASLEGLRRGPKPGAPHFDSRKDRTPVRHGAVKQEATESAPEPVPHSGTAPERKAGILGLQPEERVNCPPRSPQGSPAV